MRIVLNLASQPFIELRPLYARLRLWMLVLLVAAIPLGLLLRTEQRRAAEADARMATIQSSIRVLQNQQSSFKTMMGQPQNEAVLSQSEFLNQLFARKAFSWTAVMMDLEDVLPGGVQVLNIDPIVAPDGRVTIRMRVAGPRERTVELVRNLEHSQRFLQPRLASEAAQTSSTAGSQPAYQNVGQSAAAPAGVDFDILAGFNPLPNKALAAAESGAPQPETSPTPAKRKHRNPSGTSQQRSVPALTSGIRPATQRSAPGGAR